MVLGALAALLALEPDMDVIEQVQDGKLALAAVARLAPDVLIADIEMPGMTGLEVAHALHSNAAVKIIILTTFARPGYLQRALQCNVRGYLLKESPSSELAAAIRRVHAGEQVINPRLAAEALSETDPLTEREREVLRLADRGASSGEIATLLQISKGTVRNHLSQAISKLTASGRVDAARIAKSTFPTCRRWQHYGRRPKTFGWGRRRSRKCCTACWQAWPGWCACASCRHWRRSRR